MFNNIYYQISNNNKNERRQEKRMTLFDDMLSVRSGNSGRKKKSGKLSPASYDPERNAFKGEFSKELNTGENTESKRRKTDNKSDASFKEEYSEALAAKTSPLGVQSYSKAGVTFEKISENQARIKYSGLLAQCGATCIRGVYGYGSNQKWENVSDAEFMKEGEGTFSAIIPIQPGKNLNLAFKDSAGNWDNNSGMNYTFVN